MKLISVKELADRWGKDEGTIRRYVREGIISNCSGVPGMMFHPDTISKYEDIELERFSPFERKKLMNEIECLKRKNEELTNILREYQSINYKSLNLLLEQGGQANG